jgi:hypothetical protein
MTMRTTIVLSAGMLASAVALAATPPVVVEPRDDALGLGRASAPSAVTAPPVPAAASANVEHVPSANPLWAIPLLQLSATRQRPLFAPSRRPPPPVVAYQLASVPPPPPPKPAEPEKPRLSLVGTIAGGAEGIGVFLDSATRGVLRLKMGESHEGWVLRTVRRREATLQKGSQIAVLTLPPPEMSKAGLAPPAAAPPAVAPPPPNRAMEGADKSSPAPANPVSAGGGSLSLPISGTPGLLGAGTAPLAFPTPAFPPTANPLREQQTIRR